MAVTGSRITVDVRRQVSRSPQAGVSVTVSPQVFLTPEMDGSPTSTVVSNGMGEAVCYAPPGTYSFDAGAGMLAIADQVVDYTFGGGLSDTDEQALTALVGGKLAKDQNLADVEDAADARDNLGLGTAALADLVDFDAAGTAAAAVTALVDAAPGALDTLNELAAALGDDANYAATVTAALAAKVGYTDLAVNVKNPTYGALGNNSADDTTALQAAFTAGIGKAIYVPDGVYLISGGLTLDATSSLVLSDNAEIKASATIAGPMLTIGSNATWWQNQVLTGGLWNCNDNAQNAVSLKAGLASTLRNFRWLNPTSHGVILGDTGASNTTHELRISDLKGDKTQAVARIAGSYGIWYRNCFDTYTSNVAIIGPEKSIRNDGNANTFVGVHGYGLGSSQFPVTVFSENGSDNSYVECYADTPATYGWEFTSNAYRWKIIGGKVYNNTSGSDNTVIAVHTVSAHPNPPCLIAFLTVIGVDASHRILTDYDGTVPSNNITIIGNMVSQPGLGADQSNVTNRNLALNMIADLRIPRIVSFGAGPTAAAGGGAGTSPPAPVVDGTATDMRCRVSMGTGTGPAAGVLATVTFARAYAARPVVHVQPVNAATAGLGVLYPSSISTTGFSISCTGTPAASQAVGTYVADAVVIG